MKEAIYYAISVYHNKKAFNKMQKNAMKADFSWKVSSEKYMDMYKELLEK